MDMFLCPLCRLQHDRTMSCKEAVLGPISSEASTTTDRQELEKLQKAAARLLHYKKDAEALRSLTGMQPSVFWPIVMTGLIEHMSGQIQSGMQQLMKNSNASQASDPPPAPSSQASTEQVALDVPTQGESRLQYSLVERISHLEAQRFKWKEQAYQEVLRIHSRMEELQAQINALRAGERDATVSLLRRIACLETLTLSPRRPPTSTMMPKVDFTTQPAPKTAGPATSSSPNTRSTSKRSRPPKSTKAASVSSSAKRKPAVSGATLSSQRAKRWAATLPRSSRKEA